MKKIFKNLLIASSLLLPITTVASATLSSIINSEVQNNKVPEIQKGNYEFDGKFFDSAEEAKQYAINNTEKKLEQINTGEASWKINYNGSDKMLDSYDFQKFNEYAQKTNEYIIYADEKSIVENTISESTGQINSTWFNSVFIEAQSPTEYKEYYRGNNNSIYKTKDDAIASLTNSNNSALFFNDIYFQNPSDLRNYLNNIYFNKDNPGYATDKYSNSIRLTAPNGNVSEMIVFDQAGEWKKIASDFIINNSEKIIEFSTDNGFVYLTEKNIDKVLNYLSVEDVPYVDVASNQGNQTWYIDINKDDESTLIGPKWYSGPSDLSTITDKSLWIRNQSFNSDIVSQNAFQELLSGLFQNLLGENKLDYISELFNFKGDNNAISFIQKQYKILLEMEGYISIYNEAVESYRIMASGKSFNYFDKIPLLYSFITSRLIKAKAPQKVIYFTNSYFKDIINVIQKQIDIIFSEVPGNVLLSKNGKDTLNLIDLFGFGTKKISLNLPSSAFFNEIFNNYTKFVFAGLGYLESLPDINCNFTTLEMGVTLLNAYLGYLPKNTSPEEKQEYIAAAKDTYKYFVNQNKYTLLANNEIFKKYSSDSATLPEKQAVSNLIEKLETENVKNSIIEIINDNAAELYLSNNKWENVDINNKFRWYSIWAKEVSNLEFTPNDILENINVTSADNLLYWNKNLVNMNFYFNQDPQGRKIYNSIEKISTALVNNFNSKETEDNFEKTIENFAETSKINLSMYKATYMDFNSFLASTIMDVMGDLSKNKEIFIRNADDNLVFDNKFEIEMFNIINSLTNDEGITFGISLLYNTYNKIQKIVSNLDFKYQMNGLDAEWDYSNPELIDNINKFNTMYAYFVNKNWSSLSTEFLKLNIQIIDNPRFTFDGAYDVLEEKEVLNKEINENLNFKLDSKNSDVVSFVNKYAKEIKLTSNNQAEIKSNGLGSISYISNSKFIDENNNSNLILTNYDSKNNEYDVKLEKFLQPAVPSFEDTIYAENDEKLNTKNIDFTLAFHKLETNKNILGQTYFYNYLNDELYNEVPNEEFIRVKNLTLINKELFSGNETNKVEYNVSSNWEKVLNENQGISKPADFITYTITNNYDNSSGRTIDSITSRINFGVPTNSRNNLSAYTGQKTMIHFNANQAVNYNGISYTFISSGKQQFQNNVWSYSSDRRLIPKIYEIEVFNFNPLTQETSPTTNLRRSNSLTDFRTTKNSIDENLTKNLVYKKQHASLLNSGNNGTGSSNTSQIIKPGTLEIDNNSSTSTVPKKVEKTSVPLNTQTNNSIAIDKKSAVARSITPSISQSPIKKVVNIQQTNGLSISENLNSVVNSTPNSTVPGNVTPNSEKIQQIATTQTEIQKKKGGAKVKQILIKVAKFAGGFGAAIGGVAFIIQMVMMFLPREKQVSYSYNVGDVSYTWLGGKEEFNTITSWEIKGLKDMKINDPVKISDSFTRDFKYYDGEEYVDDTQLKMKFLSNVLSKKGEAESDTPWYSSSSFKKGYTFDILDSKIENTILPESIWGVLDAKASPEELSKDILSKINSESDLNTSEYASNILHKYDNGYSNWSSVNESAAIARAVDEILSNIRNTYISLKPIEDSEGFVSKRKEYNLIPGNSYDSLLNRIVTREEKIKQDPNFNDNNFIIDNTANVVDPITGEFADMNKMSAQINAKNISTANYNKYMSDKIKTIKAELAVYNGANDDFSKLNGLNGTTVSSLAVNEYGDVNYFVNSLKKDGFGNIVGRSSSNKNAVNWLFDQYQLEKINKKTWTYVYEYKNQYFLSIDSLIESFGGINKIDNNGKKV